MASCLDNLVGIKHCSQPETDCYVNGIQGISTELAENIANADQANFLGVWNAVKERAQNRLKDDVIEALRSVALVNFNQVIFQTKKLRKTPANTVVDGTNLRGIYVKVVNSKYLALYLDKVYIFSNETATTELTIKNVNDGEDLITPVSVDLVYGLNTVVINEYFPLVYGAVEFAILTTPTYTSRQTFQDLYVFDSVDCDCARRYSIYPMGETINQIAPVEIEPGQDVIYENLQIGGIGLGIVAEMQIQCSIESFICINRNLIKRAYQYLLAYELLNEKLASSVGGKRMNWFTFGNFEQTKETRDDIEKQYNKALATFSKSVTLSGEEMCMDCDDNLQSTHIMVMP